MGMTPGTDITSPRQAAGPGITPQGSSPSFGTGAGPFSPHVGSTGFGKTFNSHQSGFTNTGLPQAKGTQFAGTQDVKPPTTQYKAASILKQASAVFEDMEKQGFDWRGMLNSAYNWYQNNPMAGRAIGGALMGGLTGGIGGGWRGAGLGALAGAGLGAGGHYAWNQWGRPEIKKPAPTTPGA